MRMSRQWWPSRRKQRTRSASSDASRRRKLRSNGARPGRRWPRSSSDEAGGREARAPNKRGEQMETVELSQQQSARMAELPEDYRVVGIDHSAPLVRKPTGQIIRIQQNGRLTAATSAARHRLASASP